MLQQSKPDDYVIATGKQYSVRDLIKIACNFLKIKIEFTGSGKKECVKIVDAPKNNTVLKKGDVIVKVDQKYFRPTETDSLQGDYTKAKRMLNWMPEIDFETLIEEMIATDIYDAKADLLVKKHLDT